VKITKIEPILVHVNHRGLIGLGEASHGGNDAQVVLALKHCADRILGQDPFRIQAIWASLDNRHQGRPYRTALSAIEQALWDIAGQALQVPIHVFLGGALRKRIRLYANINRHVVDRSPEGFARAAHQAVQEGFTAVKLAPFDEVKGPAHIRTGPQAAWQKGVARVRAVREAIGDQVELMVDCHGRFDASEALAVARELADCNLTWFEEPVPHTFTQELAWITERAPMPIASAESVYAVEGFRPFLCHHVVDVIMPDVKHDGGILETVRIAAAARMQRLLVAPHNPSGPVSTAVSAQVASTMPNFFILEYAWGEAAWRADLLSPPERIEAGELILPSGPGLGHKLNADIVAAHHIQEPSTHDSSKAVPM